MPIKSISFQYRYYDNELDSYKYTTKVYNFTNKKSATIKIPKFQINKKKHIAFYDIREYSVEYSNNKKEDSSKFSETSSVVKQQYITKKTTITEIEKFKSPGRHEGNIKYTIKANKKTAKIRMYL